MNVVVSQTGPAYSYQHDALYDIWSDSDDCWDKPLHIKLCGDVTLLIHTLISEQWQTVPAARWEGEVGQCLFIAV